MEKPGVSEAILRENVRNSTRSVKAYLSSICPANTSSPVLMFTIWFGSTREQRRTTMNPFQRSPGTTAANELFEEGVVLRPNANVRNRTGEVVLPALGRDVMQVDMFEYEPLAIHGGRGMSDRPWSCCRKT